jgi:splicing factor 45
MNAAPANATPIINAPAPVPAPVPLFSPVPAPTPTPAPAPIIVASEPSSSILANRVVDEYDPARPNDYEELCMERERVKKLEAEERRAKKGTRISA